jgi:transposase
MAEFARREGIKVKHLYWWRWKLRSSGEQAVPSKPEFLPVRVVGVTPAPTGTPIEIALPNGRLVRVRPGFDAATLERVLAIAAEQEVAC